MLKMPQRYSAGQGTASRSSVQCDCLYFKSLPAIFKIIQVTSSLIAFICLQNFSIRGCGGCIEWLQTAAMSGLIFSCVLLIVYFLHVFEACDKFPWHKINVIGCIFWTVFDLSTATNLAIRLNRCRLYGTCADHLGPMSSTATAIAFEYIATIAYGYDAGLQLFRIMRGKPA